MRRENVVTRKRKEPSPEAYKQLQETLQTLANVLQDGLSDEAQTIADKIIHEYPKALRDTCNAVDTQVITVNEKDAVVYAMVRIASVMLSVRAKDDSERVLN